jgi:transcriptional regulator with XRE-family HTH domain
MSVKVAEFTAQDAQMQDGKPRYNPSMLPVIRDLGLKGRSRHQIAMQLGVSEKTLGNWEKAHPELKDMIDFAYTAAQAFYETMVDAAIFDPAFQSNVYKLIMESRFSDTYSPRKGPDKGVPDEGLSYEDKIKLIETQVRRYTKEPD